jgi:AraC-like DNA-binding protein
MRCCGHSEELTVREPMPLHLELPNISVRIMHDTLVDAGVNPDGLFRAARIGRSVVDNPSATVRVSGEKACQHAFAQMTRDVPDLSADVGARFQPALFGVAGLALLTSPTLRDWARFVGLVDFHYSVATHRLVRVDESTDALEVTVPAGTDPVFARMSIERDMAALLNFFDDLWRAPFPYERIELCLPDVPKRIRGLATAEVSLGPVTRIVWHRELTDAQLPHGNRHAFELYCERAVAQFGITPRPLRVADRVLEILGEPGNIGLPLEEVARRLWMSSRTLQRRLHEDEIEYRALRDVARCTEAKRLLAHTGLPISKIAADLGFAEPSGLSTAFKRWVKVTPSTYRSQTLGSTRHHHSLSAAGPTAAVASASRKVR